jgi:hypothetical protein
MQHNSMRCNTQHAPQHAARAATQRMRRGGAPLPMQQSACAAAQRMRGKVYLASPALFNRAAAA